jgi:putative FmdB family regulatory protein
LPLYEYECVKCKHRFEKIESLSASTVKKCPKCGAKAERQLSASAIQFKGTGWYVTDYAGKKPDSSSSENSGDGAASKNKEKSGESKPSESKSSDSKSSDSSKTSESSKSSSDKGTGKKKK